MAAACVSVTPASAFPHIVRRGESVAQLAERFYGRVELERVIVAANGLDQTRGTVIVAGMRLELPAVGYHKVLPGESWKTIATSLLGHPDRGDVLSQINGANPWLRPGIGREIVIPYNLRYVAGSGDTTQTVAYRFLGRRDDAWKIASYNSIKRAKLYQGEVILVPLTDLALTKSGKEAARTAGALVRSEGGGAERASQQLVNAALPKLVDNVRRGRYLEATILAAKLLAHQGLSEVQLGGIHQQLTVAYVALGARGLAATSCAKWLQHAEQKNLNPIDHSPKILEVCLGASGSMGPDAGVTP